MEKQYHTSLMLRIDWLDLDLFGHVNNVAYFRYIQAARINYCDMIGLTSLNDPEKLSFMVAGSECRFKKPLFFPGEIRILTRTEWMKNSSPLLEYLIQNNGEETIAGGQDVIVIFDHQKKTKVTIPNFCARRSESSSGGSSDHLSLLFSVPRFILTDQSEMLGTNARKFFGRSFVLTQKNQKVKAA